ncbi:MULTISPECIES: gp53-like domain-containing protein [Pseudomonas]|uniref:gp53-like domain-containing protein n=1 Tax=Pseudomonas TaxID=286 RepID=UPI0013047CE3|nr:MULTISPECIES: hypothetical protein [Pseudomonas]
MADLPEPIEWTSGIYQLETSDPVLGGPEGIDNLQAKQLASRTQWLKDQIEKVINGATTIGKAIQLATARTFTLSGAVTGSAAFDGTANANIVVTLANSGVSAGTYPKVQVNAKGLVTGGAALNALDIPDLDWSKITSGKPTTLEGYGITGGSFTENVRMVGARSVDVMASATTSWAGGLHVRTLSGADILGGFGAWGNNDSVNCLYMGLSSAPWNFGYGVRVQADGVYISGPLTANGGGLTNVPWGSVVGTPNSLGGYGVSFASQSEAETGADTNKPMNALRVFQAIAAKVIQATESVLGIARIATQTLVNAGTDDTTIVTPKKLRMGVSMLLGSTGYIALPVWLGGLIFQWGIATGVPQATATAGSQGPTRDISLPIAFPTNPLRILASMHFSTMTTPAAFAPGAIFLSSSQIRVQNNYTASAGDIAWFAVGC